LSNIKLNPKASSGVRIAQAFISSTFPTFIVSEVSQQGMQNNYRVSIRLRICRIIKKKLLLYLSYSWYYKSKAESKLAKIEMKQSHKGIQCQSQGM